RDERPVVILAGTVLDGRGGRTTPTRIGVRGARIESVAPARGRGDAGTYHLTPHTPLPRLLDAPAHPPPHPNPPGRLPTKDDGETPAQGALAMAANAWATLRAGITTAQSPGSPEDADLRAAIASGLPGPLLLTSLEPLDQTSGSPDELRAKVRERKQAGADRSQLFAATRVRGGGGRRLSE